MATLQDVIRRITIMGKTDGVNQAAAELKGLAVAQDGVAKSSLSMASKIEALQKSLDAEYRAEKQLESVQKTLTAARAQGLITVQRQNELATLAASKYRTEGEAAAKAGEGLKMLKEASLGFASGLGAGVLFGGISELPTAIAEAVERMGKTANVAETIGITTKALQELRFAAQQSDVDIGTLDAAMEKFSTNLGKAGSPLDKILALNHVKITGDTLTDLEHFADLVKNASNQEERNALVTAGMGKSAQEMGQLFRDGGEGIARWAREADNAGIMTDEELQRARELGDEMKALVPELQNAQNEFALLVVPSEIVALTTFNEGLHQTRDILTDIANLNFSGLLGKLGSLGTAISAGPGGFMAWMQADAVQRKAINSITVHGGAASSISGPTLLPKAPDTAAASAQKKYDNETDALKREIAALTESNRQQAEANALNSAGITITDKSAGKIITLADALYDQKQAIDAANQAAQFFGTTLTDAFTGIVTGSKNVVTAMLDIAKSIGQALIQSALLGSGPLAQLLGTAPARSGGIGGFLGPILGSIFGGGAITPAIHHAGGIVGVDGMQSGRAFDAALWAKAPRYHFGGIAGLAPNEVPAILQRGERIIPANGNGAGPSIVINNYGSKSDAAENARATAKALPDAIAAYQRNSRRR